MKVLLHCLLKPALRCQRALTGLDGVLKGLRHSRYAVIPNIPSQITGQGYI